MNLRVAETCEESVFQGCNYGTYTGQYPTLQNCVYEETLKKCGKKEVEESDTDGDRRLSQIKSNVNEIEYLQSRIASNKKKIYILSGLALIGIGYLMLKK